ncbi:hypothetical protein C0Q70_16976 [Pomacea canaliculata]|uniref:B-box C-terminal domain-containing protein n=1 Tax=Pomacea canaliculata TaxID=400727 RepID=A0A2T7NRD3_POMCA|nr:hypothetical protein C0Q70_16976 [Pomacea canaliculata]
MHEHLIKHCLLETEAENVRSSILNAVQHVKSFGEEVSESARRLAGVIQQIEGGIQVIPNTDGVPTAQQMVGTAEQARLKIKHYFSELRENLNRQEIAALAAVDTHIREKLCMLRQQQEDMAILLSQIHAVCQQCEATLQQDDTKVLLAKAEVSHLLDTVQKQAAADNRVHIGPKIEMPVIFVLDCSNRERLTEAQNELVKLVQEKELKEASLLIFANKQDVDDHASIEEITQQMGLLKMCCNRSWHLQGCSAKSGEGLADGLEWLSRQMVAAGAPELDNRVHIGPKIEMRVLMLGLDGAGKTCILFKLKKNEFVKTIPTVALIFVLDCSNRERLTEAQNELVKMVQEKELKEVSLLIFANKQDVEDHASIEEITQQMGLLKMCCNRSWHLQGCSAKSGEGLADGLEWLSRQMVAAGAPELA